MDFQSERYFYSNLISNTKSNISWLQVELEKTSDLGYREKIISSITTAQTQLKHYRFILNELNGLAFMK